MNCCKIKRTEKCHSVYEYTEISHCTTLVRYSKQIKYKIFIFFTKTPNLARSLSHTHTINHPNIKQLTTTIGWVLIVKVQLIFSITSE